MRLPAFELRRRLYIIFRGEEGLDYGGVARFVISLLVNTRVEVIVSWFQGMVLLALPRGPQPHVLPLRVRQQEQLQSSDQPRLLRQPRPPALFQVHRALHRHGSVPWEVYLLRLHDALLQEDAEQETGHEGYRVYRPRVLQFIGIF